MTKSNNGLSEQDIKLLDYISKGYEYKEIAAKMFISVDTVKSRLSAIRKKLNAGNRANVIYIATKKKLIK